jgi:hypothetical protein
MGTTPQIAATEINSSTPKARKTGVCRVGGGFLLGAMLLVGLAFQSAGSAGASVVSAKASLRPAQVVALNGTVAHRLNVIRVSFGLAEGVATSEYSSEVSQAVALNEDPPFAPSTGGVVGEEGLWGMVPGTTSATAASALETVNGWVYHDGWDGSAAATWNADCTSPHAPGCDGHRRNVLSTPPVPGAKLYIDVQTKSVSFDGAPALAVAALFVWKTGSAA